MMDNSVENTVDELASILIAKELSVTCAESCTGGLIAAAITSQAGASKFFKRGFITYSNDAKTDMLGVSPHIINNCGAVSYECASTMAIGAVKAAKADIAVSVTGIAGPDGGSNEKPVGLVYISTVISGHEPISKEFRFNGTRNDIRAQSCDQALIMLRDAARAV